VHRPRRRAARNEHASAWQRSEWLRPGRQSIAHCVRGPGARCNARPYADGTECSTLYTPSSADKKAAAIEMEVIAMRFVVIGAEHRIEKSAGTAADIPQKARFLVIAGPLAQYADAA
jgi:hypothetical protein